MGAVGHAIQDIIQMECLAFLPVGRLAAADCAGQDSTYQRIHCHAPRAQTNQAIHITRVTGDSAQLGAHGTAMMDIA